MERGEKVKKGIHPFIKLTLSERQHGRLYQMMEWGTLVKQLHFAEQKSAQPD